MSDKDCPSDPPAHHPTGAPWRNFYGRFKGKTLKDSQKRYLDEDLDVLSPGPVSWEDNPRRDPLDLATRFGSGPLWLEIGFGGGEHLVHQAGRNPDVSIIGAEPFINGVAMLLGKIRRAGVTNLAVHPGDALPGKPQRQRGPGKQCSAFHVVLSLLFHGPSRTRPWFVPLGRGVKAAPQRGRRGKRGGG